MAGFSAEEVQEIAVVALGKVTADVRGLIQLGEEAVHRSELQARLLEAVEGELAQRSAPDALGHVEETQGARAARDLGWL